MGIKHLLAVEEFLENNKGKYFTMTRIKMECNLNTSAINEVLSYLLSHGIITMIDENKKIKYGWKL